MKRRLIGVFVIGMLLTSIRCTRQADLFAEEFSGGVNFTSYNFSKDAFGSQGKNLTREESRFFQSGNELFRTNWVAAPASVKSLDGLGPVFNAPSCGSCHFKDGRGAPPDEPNGTRFGLLWRVNNGQKDDTGAPTPHPVYGGQIQDLALPKIKPDARVKITYDTIYGSYEDGIPYLLYRPNYKLADLAYGQMDSTYGLSPRIAPQVAGLGLLENIREEDILANQDIEDQNSDGISGKANYVYDFQEGKKTIGRFGWKANQPTVMQQSAGAFNGDMGLTNSFFPDDDFSEIQRSYYDEIHNGGNPEVSYKQLDRISLYIKSLAVPAKRNLDQPEYSLGRKLFYDIGCESCHKASFITGDSDEISALNNQEIYCYTDLLLHDMGEGLADNLPDHDATGTEWKTPPLWGIGLINTVNKHTRLLHDGRARNTEQAILWHDGEAKTTKDKFTNLMESERKALILFVESL